MYTHIHTLSTYITNGKEMCKKNVFVSVIINPKFKRTTFVMSPNHLCRAKYFQKYSQKTVAANTYTSRL